MKKTLHPEPASVDVTDKTEQRRLYLRASIKILVATGFLFLLIPFIKSIPWPHEEIPADSVFLSASDIAEGATQKIMLSDGSAVYVTRNSPTLRMQLQSFPEENLWFPSAPDIASQDWFVVRATNALDEPVQFLPPQTPGKWPGGFVATSGAAWDLAGRALKPSWPGHPSGYAMKVQNLPPMPFKPHEGGVLLLPLPSVPAAATSE